LVADNETHVVVPRVVARSLNTSLAFMFDCVKRQDGSVYLLYGYTYVYKTRGGFQEARAGNIGFGPCQEEYCLYGKEWLGVTGVERMYAVVSWFPPGADGYRLINGGYPVEVKIS
jgi:hypothetical protein